MDDSPAETRQSPPNRKQIGTTGESEAARFLEARGYRIVDSNVRPIGGASRGEIDLVAWRDEYLVFIEVKTRRARRGMQLVPAEAVDLRKRRQLVLLAEAYVTRHNLEGVSCRFDVVEVTQRGDALHFNLIENAFDGNDI